MSLADAKARIRESARAKRLAVVQPQEISRRILDRLMATDLYSGSQRVLFYVSLQGEVDTRDHLRAALESDKTIFVPLCVGNQLRLFQLNSMDELATQTFGILEPTPELWDDAWRFSPVDAIDLAIVPGVAFGRDGTRIGNARGYYDRLFCTADERPFRLGVAFECQMFDSVPQTPNDVSMHAVLTETAVYPNANSLSR